MLSADILVMVHQSLFIRLLAMQQKPGLGPAGHCGQGLGRQYQSLQDNNIMS